MGSQYKLTGPPGNTVAMRDFKRWVLVFPDGDELCLSRKRYAWDAAKVILARGGGVHIYEETVMRSIFANDELKEDTFRIEVTDRLKYEMKEERVTIKTEDRRGRWSKYN